MIPTAVARLGSSWHNICRLKDVIAIPLASQQQPRLESVRVLVVEDDPDMRALLYDSLLLQGMSGDVAADGLEGLKLALERSFDVVVSDTRPCEHP